MGVIVVIIIALLGGYWYARPLLLTGTGYAAHNECALRTIGGRSNVEADLPSNPLVPYLRTTDDEASVRASVLGVLAVQRAHAAEGYGCTVGAQAPELPEPTRVLDSNPVLTRALVPPPADLESAINRAFGDDLDHDAKAALGTRAVVVLHEGRLVAERYADGFTEFSPQLGWSMAKSATNLLVGRLVHDGVVDIDEPLEMGWADDASGAITLDDLLRMRSGLAWDETYDLGTPITSMLYLQRDMGAFAAGQPQEHPVGTVQEYSSGSTNIVCKALVQATGQGADLPRSELFAPLGLSRAVWEPDGAGVPVCSSYLWATPREFAVLGQFALDDGVVGGERLLPEGWIAESTTAEPVVEAEDSGYGSSWWVNLRPDGTLSKPNLPADAYWMQGHDGQRTYVVPSADLVVVRMGFSPDAPDLRADQLVIDLVSVLG